MSRTPTVKTLPPARPAVYVPRDRLSARLAGAVHRRLTVVVAGAGFGKSTLLADWWASTGGAWYTVDAADATVPVLAAGLETALRARVPGLRVGLPAPLPGPAESDIDQATWADRLAAQLCEALDRELADDLVLVLDDVQELAPGTAAARLIEGLCRHAPPAFHLVLSSRDDAPFPVGRLHGRGQVLDLRGEQFAFTRAEVAAVVREALGDRAGGVAEAVHRATDGWPAAVLLAVEALRGREQADWATTLADFQRPHGRLFGYLAEEVYADQPTEARDVLRRLAELDQFTPELCAAIGLTGAGPLIAALSHRGLFLERHGEWCSLHPLVRQFARTHHPLDPEEARALRVRAAHWLAETGEITDALRLLVSAGDGPALAAFLTRQGAALLRSGAVTDLQRACHAVPAGARNPAIDLFEGEARRVTGDWQGALTCFGRFATDPDQLPAALAWRMGLIHHLRGELDEALRIYQLGCPEPGAGDEPAESVKPDADSALLLAWTSAAHWLRGELTACRRAASRAAELATACGDASAIAAAHTALAMLAALDADHRSNAAHYLRALAAAEQAGDVLQLVRIRTNRSSLLVEEGAYAEALRELEIAIDLAELSSFAGLHALALHNRGQARLRLGELDQAMVDFTESRQVYQRIGSRLVAYPLAGIGDVHRLRGNLALARASYEEAVGLAEQVGDTQGMVPALAGLARVLVGEDPETAARSAERALACGTSLHHVNALLAAGWVAHARGDVGEASRYGDAAARAARPRRDQAGLAEALALLALSADQPDTAARRLDEAAAICRDIRDPVGDLCAQLARGRLGRGPRSAARAAAAARRLEALGVRGQPAAGILLAVAQHGSLPVRVRSLGAFGVLRGGEPVPLTEWQSRKARDLVKILVAHRGRAVTRDYLMQTLWPDEDPARVANRLSVALTTARSVLDPPRRFPPERFLTADKDTVAVNPANVRVDLEEFLAASADGLDRLRLGATDEVLDDLRAAEVAYTGDFLEENAYDDWAVPAREEARAAYLAVARALGHHAAAHGDPDAAVRYFLRVLERDRYDEDAYLALVGALADAGRHGEAHRHYRAYRGRMAEISVEPVPFPGGRRRTGAPAAPTGCP